MAAQGCQSSRLPAAGSHEQQLHSCHHSGNGCFPEASVMKIPVTKPKVSLSKENTHNVCMSIQTSLNGVCIYSYTQCQCHGISTELESILKSALDKIHSLGKKFPSNTLILFFNCQNRSTTQTSLDANIL